MAEAFLGEIRLVPFVFAPQDWLLCQGQTLSIQQYTALYSLLGTTYGGDGVNNFKLPDLQGRFATQTGTGPLGSTGVFGTKGGTTPTPVSTSSSFTLTNANQLPSHTHTATFTGTGGGAAVQPAITVKVSNDTAATTPAPAPGATPIANGYIAHSAIASVGAQPAIYTATATTGTTTLNAATAVATGGSGGGITGGTVAVASTGTSQPVAIPLTFGVPPAMPPYLAMNYIICVTNGIYPMRP